MKNLLGSLAIFALLLSLAPAAHGLPSLAGRYEGSDTHQRKITFQIISAGADHYALVNFVADGPHIIPPPPFWILLTRTNHTLWQWRHFPTGRHGCEGQIMPGPHRGFAQGHWVDHDGSSLYWSAQQQ